MDAGKNYKKNQCGNAQPCAQAMRNSINQLFTPVWFAVYQISDLLLFEKFLVIRKPKKFIIVYNRGEKKSSHGSDLVLASQNYNNHLSSFSHFVN
jgi:hypothetical protein